MSDHISDADETLALESDTSFEANELENDEGFDDDEEGLEDEGEYIDVEEVDTEEDIRRAARRQRPTPPPGFVPFKWKKARHESGCSVNVCPQCGKFGSSWFGGGYTDPAIRALDEEWERKRAEQEARWAAADTDDLETTVEDEDAGAIQQQDFFHHWSRYGLGSCSHCGVEFWHDFVGNCSKPSEQWHYYYKPTKGQLGLF